LELFGFGKKSHAGHVSFVRPVSCGHLPEASSIMNGIILPKTEPLLIFFLTTLTLLYYNGNDRKKEGGKNGKTYHNFNLNFTGVLVGCLVVRSH
jgi:hypothetical protein